ncbi:MAG TPA: tetratricopeptide repeat protein [Methylomirabilota bacterium]
MSVIRGGVRAWPALLALLAAVWLAGPSPAAAQLSDADVYVAEATLKIEDRQWDEALALLRQALTREPEHVEALYYTGVAYMGKKDPNQAIRFLEQARQKSPDDTSILYQLGLAHFALEQYDRAQPLFERAFGQDDTVDSLGYYVGYLRYRKEQYQEALKAFRGGRTSDPTIADLTKLYAGLSLQQLGLSSQAEAEIAQIGKLQPASPLTGPAERLKSSLSAARDTARRFRAEVKLGAFYDDNAGAEPDFAHDVAVVLARENNRRTFGELFSLGLEYDWLRSGPWTSTFGMSVFGTHNNTLASFDIDDYTGIFRVSRRGTLFDVPMQTGFNFTYDYLTLGYEELVQRYSMSGYLALVESARHLTNVQARIEIKRYREKESEPPVVIPSELNQDATNWLVGFTHFIRFDRDRHFIKGGYQLDIEQAQGTDYSYVGHRFILGAQYTLPWRDIRLTYDIDLHYRDYLHTNRFLPPGAPGSKERNDKELTNTARAEVPLPWFFKGQSFFVTGEYTNKSVDSNIDSFRYHRNYAAVYFTWQY